MNLRWAVAKNEIKFRFLATTRGANLIGVVVEPGYRRYIHQLRSHDGGQTPAFGDERI